jgi:hypothetical protein
MGPEPGFRIVTTEFPLGAGATTKRLAGIVSQRSGREPFVGERLIDASSALAGNSCTWNRGQLKMPRGRPSVELHKAAAMQPADPGGSMLEVEKEQQSAIAMAVEPARSA